MKKSILIIDKSECLFEDIKNFFTDRDIDVHHSVSSVEGIQILHKYLPELVIADTVIDCFSAFDIAKYLKQTAILKKTRIIIYSSVVSPKNFFYSQNSHADVFYNKKDIGIEKLCALCLDILESSSVKPPDAGREIPDRNKILTDMDSIYCDLMLKDTFNSRIFNLLSSVDSPDSLIENFFIFLNRYFHVKAGSILLDTRNDFMYYEKSTDKITTEERERIFNEVKSHFIEQNNLNSMPDKDFYRRRFSFFICDDGDCNSGIEGENIFSFFYNGKYIILYIGHCFKTADEYTYLLYVISAFDKMLKQVWNYHEEVVYAGDIRYSFSKFIPEKIIDDLMRKKTDKELMVGEKRNITVLFSHIRNFNEIEQNNSAEDTVYFLNNHFSIFSTSIKNHGGTINKYINDAVFAMFGAPEGFENNIERCLLASIEVLNHLKNIDNSNPERSVIRYRIGIGIHEGDVIIGNIGSRDSFDYTGIGDNINLAARLESLNKYYDTDILISEEVKRTAAGYSLPVQYREIDTIKVKGRTTATTVFSVEPENYFSEKFMTSYNKGVKMFRLGNWNLALNFFMETLSIQPEDHVTKIYIDRCSRFSKNPPETWDGSVKLDFK
ncbi:MAG: adenylate/guanylate cyclase domain-containing response regulator [Spirochaetes bacterium]|nr:adenylate/guanylate cyclase domain-containing response regulator [Spirochaetota bacterium]